MGKSLNTILYTDPADTATFIYFSISHTHCFKRTLIDKIIKIQTSCSIRKVMAPCERRKRVCVCVCLWCCSREITGSSPVAILSL